MTLQEHIDAADRYLTRAAAMSSKYGVCVESIPAVNALAALALAHAATAQAQLMARKTAPRAGTPEWAPRIQYPHDTPLPCYEDDLNRCGCSTCINEPKVPGKRPA
jgi:hypothetical protein